MKRKYPARGSARADHKSKKRASSPDIDSSRSVSATPAPGVGSGSVPPEETQTPLPFSIQAGQPLPTIETPQPEELSNRDYQSYKESGVLSESLSRSRNKWVTEGLFEKYWTKPIKPSKKKGNAPPDDPNNPSKDTMIKIGQVIIAIEPHTFEATMFGVKDTRGSLKPAGSTVPASQPLAPLPATNAVFRPILQYGPPNGVMPPKPAPPAPTLASVHTSASAPSPSDAVPASPVHTSTNLAQAAGAPSAMAHQHNMAFQNLGAPHPVQNAATNPTMTLASAQGTPSIHAIGPTTQPQPPGANPPVQPATAAAAANGKTPGPIIIALAERASSDEYLREIMKKVAEGTAIPTELAHFQQVIDQITTQHKKTAPPADRLMVDGRSVKYFADEVNVIIGVILRSNPNQRAADLRPPNGSDPLVVALVKDALDNPSTTRTMIYRIATGTHKYTDSQDLKDILDKLFARVQAAKIRQIPLPASLPVAPVSQGQSTARQKLPQSLKGMPELSGIVFEFAGTNGDRYRFPKFSILNPVETKPNGSQQVMASFLIVRKGSTSEYGGDPELDYYQPMTIKIIAQSGRYLDLFSRVVAPEEEVRRYMDDVFDHMTRAEYVLLAMRLPRPYLLPTDRDDDISMMGLDDSRTGTPALLGPGSSSHTATPTLDSSVKNKPVAGVLWGKSVSVTGGTPVGSPTVTTRASEEQEKQERYHKLVNSAAAKEVVDMV